MLSLFDGNLNLGMKDLCGLRRVEEFVPRSLGLSRVGEIPSAPEWTAPD